MKILSVPGSWNQNDGAMLGKNSFGITGRLSALALMLVLAPVFAVTGEETAPPMELDGPPPLHSWSFQTGVAVITSNTIDQLARLHYNRASGEAGGEAYFLQVSRTLLEDQWTIAGRQFHPTLELPLVLGVVNERGRSVFRDYNFGVTLRWRDFPWNEILYTNFETGGGLSYTDRVMRIEEVRHPGRDRSHLKFYWPLQLTLAHPRHRQHQGVLFIHHQSGGRIFDKGGSNLIGIGYRFVPGKAR